MQIFHVDVVIQENSNSQQLDQSNWPNDPTCKLCSIDPETPTYLCKDCVFIKQVWSILKQWLGLSVLYTVPTGGSIHNYWQKCRAKIDKDQRRVFDGIMIYLWWNVWKERNRRISQNILMQPRQVAFLCKEEIEQHQLAMRNHGESNSINNFLAIAV